MGSESGERAGQGIFFNRVVVWWVLYLSCCMQPKWMIAAPQLLDRVAVVFTILQDPVPDRQSSAKPQSHAAPCRHSGARLSPPAPVVVVRGVVVLLGSTF